MRHPHRFGRDGFAVVTVLLLSVVLMALVAAMFALTNVEIDSSGTNADMTSGFYAAEAGLNVRGELIRSEFQGYSRPSGTSPDEVDACVGLNDGAGDFECQTLTVNDRTVTTYVLEDPRNNDPSDADRTITIPPGELFAGLSAIQYRYSVLSDAVPPNETRPEAILEMTFRVRLVPMFQFAAFYDKDLEILPGANMTLDGRVHTNGDLYTNANATLRINGQVTAAIRSDGTGGNVHRGRKDRNECGGTVRVESLVAGVAPALACQGSSSYTPVPQSALAPFQGQIRTGLDTLTVPPPSEFDRTGMYWEQADVRIALDLRNGLANARAVALRPETALDGEPVEDPVLTAHLTTCLAADSDARGYGSRAHPEIGQTLANPATVFGTSVSDIRAVEWSNSFRDRRENSNDARRTSYRLMLEVDVAGLLDCLHEERSDFFSGRPTDQDGIDTLRNGGLVWYFTVLGANESDASSGYGVRLRNANALAATASGSPDINGLTVVSDQALFTTGDYNRTDWRPAALLADTINVLSGVRSGTRYTTDAATSVTNPNLAPNLLGINSRVAVNTTVRAAFLANTDTTGDVDGTAGQGGNYNGGLENYPRLHENWSNRTLQYAGSFVSLGEPLHSSGRWPGTGTVYNAPVRDWNYDTNFNDVANLPPLTPRFVYLVQERFIREFDR